jgi:hypothetical protein
VEKLFAKHSGKIVRNLSSRHRDKLFQNTMLLLIVEIQLAVVDKVDQRGRIFQVQFF